MKHGEVSVVAKTNVVCFVVLLTSANRSFATALRLTRVLIAELLARDQNMHARWNEVSEKRKKNKKEKKRKKKLEDQPQKNSFCAH